MWLANAPPPSPILRAAIALVAVLSCVAVVLWPTIKESRDGRRRVFHGTEVPYVQPKRPKTRVLTTGRRACGQIVEITPSKVTFVAASAPGDSGGPVYSVHPDGTASAVGINFAHVDVDSSYFRDGPRRFAVAELIQPWLEKWDLTIVTTAP